MRLRELFRTPVTNERKSYISASTSSLTSMPDANTFVNSAQDKDTDALHKYLLAGFPPDQSDPSTKMTALHVAVESANIKAVQILLQAGAQVNVVDLSLSTPLHIASYMGYEEIVQVLLSYGADMYKQDSSGRNAFHLAVTTGNTRLIRHFLSANDTGQNIVHIPDAQDWTPLMCACASNHPMMCAFLLSHNADICSVNNREMTVFHIAAFLGSTAVLRELLSLSSSSNDEKLIKVINQGDNRNQTPLFYACTEGHLDIALLLLRAGANAYHLDNNDQTCLHALLSSSIILKRHIRLFHYLIQYVDFRESEDYLGRKLLDAAYLSRSNAIIDLLKALNYKTNSNIVFNIEHATNPKYSKPKQVYSLRHICILHFKRSIIYNRTDRQLSQNELLENALQQTFQITLNRDNTITDCLTDRSPDDLSLHKNEKNSKTIKVQDKKTKKSSNIFLSTNKWSSQVDLQQSTWSIFTNKFKVQRMPTSITNNSSSTLNEQDVNVSQSIVTHPMKNLAFELLTSSTKLNDLLDFPSLKNNPLIDQDLYMSIKANRLLGVDFVY